MTTYCLLIWLYSLTYDQCHLRRNEIATYSIGKPGYIAFQLASIIGAVGMTIIFIFGFFVHWWLPFVAMLGSIIVNIFLRRIIIAQFVVIVTAITSIAALSVSVIYFSELVKLVS